ncbi:MAG: hypothetical protein O7H41_04340 [Planctomycetota bacterium]|nr:hypothetical protein [Planctomycetota bacterium]
MRNSILGLLFLGTMAAGGCAPLSYARSSSGPRGLTIDRYLEHSASMGTPLSSVGQPPLQGGYPGDPVTRFQVSVRGEVGGGGDGVGSISGVEFEIRLPKGFSVAPMYLYYQYTYDEDGGPDEEEGYGGGPGVEFRWYATRDAFRGFYLGMGASLLFGHWEGDYDETGDGTAESHEEDDEVSIEVHSSLGYTFRIGPHFAISPTLIVGDYITSADEGSGVFAGVGLRLSVGF